MYTTRAVIRFTTHTSHIRVDDLGNISVFKSGSRTCDFDRFTENQQVEASDYILEPPSSIYYYVSFPGEPPPHLLS